MCLKFLITYTWVIKAKKKVTKKNIDSGKGGTTLNGRIKAAIYHSFLYSLTQRAVVSCKVPGTEKGAKINYDFVSGHKFPIWHSTEHVRERCRKRDTGEAEGKRSKNNQGR